MALSAEHAKAIDAMFASVDKPGHPGAVVAVLQAGEVVHLRAFGLANVEDGVPVTSDTIMRLGSTTKHLCAIAILMLEDQGLLSIDDLVSKHIPDAPACTQGMTLRHLLSMRSGFYDGTTLSIFAGRDRHVALSLTGQMGVVRDHDELMFAPGAQTLYSNTNYFLLSHIVEKLSGRSLAEFFRTELFEPLGMNTARLIIDMLRTVPGKAKGYLPAKDEGEFDQGLMLYKATGDGGVDMSMLDFIRWFKNYRDNKLPVRNMRARLEEPVFLNSGQPTNYRHGIEVDLIAGKPKVSHAGGMPGFLCDFCFYPEPDLGVLVFTNFMDPGLLQVADPIMQLLTDTPPDAVEGCEDPPAPGLYVDYEHGYAFHIGEVKGKPVCFMLGEPSGLIGDRTNGWRPAKRGTIWNIRACEGGDDLEVAYGAGFNYRFQRWTEGPPPQNLNELVGAYRNAPTGEVHYLSLTEDGGLKAHVGSNLREVFWGVLTPLGRDVFSTTPPGEPAASELLLKIVRDGAGRVSGFRYSTFRCRDLLFSRQS
jgi:D-aminopeptidase